MSVAECLLSAGDTVTLVSDIPITHTTSHLAAAVWFPTAAGPPDRVADWGATTFDFLERLARSGTPGVRMCESLTLHRERPPAPGWARQVRGFRPARRDELPAGYRSGFRFAVPLVEMPVFLPYLRDRVAAAGARWVRRRVERWDDLLDLAPDVVVNCAGLGARGIVPDDGLTPIRGRIVRVTNPGLTMSVRDEAHPLGRAYVHPRAADCILGGTLDIGQWDTTADPAVTQSILQRCRDLVPELAGSRVLDSLAGLRPGRAEVRLELDDASPSWVPVVHNYGHGGSGITIGYGCAQEVARIVGALRSAS